MVNFKTGLVAVVISTIAQAALFPVPPVKPTKAYSLVPFTKPQIFAVPLLVKGKKLFNILNIKKISIFYLFLNQLDRNGLEFCGFDLLQI